MASTVDDKAARPRISASTAVAIAVADMIGIGVFTSLGFQVGDLPSGFTIMALWLIGGIVALCGALSYAELAAAFPRSGGEYNLLSRALHPAAGFLAGWISATVGFAAPIALAAMAFGEYFKGVVPSAPAVPLALGLVWLVALVQLMGLKHSALFQNLWTWLKILLIVGLIVAGFALAMPQATSFAPSEADIGYMLSAPFAVSLVYVMYSYSGWNAATYIASEVEDPERTLPRALITGALIVTVLYVALNAVFLYSTPMEKLAGQVNVALIAGNHIFGEAGGTIVGALICLGLVSSISAMSWIGPRVTMVMGEDNALLQPLSRVSKAGVPATAILLQLAITTGLILTQSFNAVLEYISFSLTLCSFLTVLGVFVLRFRQPDLPRPYKAWGYPVTPLIFLAVTLYMMIFMLQERPFQSLAGLATAAAGLLLYAFSQWLQSRPQQESTGNV
jgi:APA family basic amino acid/polyamine antiporter